MLDRSVFPASVDGQSLFTNVSVVKTIVSLVKMVYNHTSFEKIVELRDATESTFRNYNLELYT